MLKEDNRLGNQITNIYFKKLKTSQIRCSHCLGKCNGNSKFVSCKKLRLNTSKTYDDNERISENLSIFRRRPEYYEPLGISFILFQVLFKFNDKRRP